MGAGHGGLIAAVPALRRPLQLADASRQSR